MPIDASIPLQAQAPQFTLNNVAQIMQMKQSMQEQKLAQSQNNALMSIYNDPSSLGADGMPNSDAVRKISQINPQLGMKMRTDQAGIAEKMALAGQHKSQAYGEQQKLIHDATDPSLNLYDEEIAKGTSPALAQQKAQAVFTESMTGLKGSGAFSDQEQARFPTAFDPVRVRAGASSYKERQAQNEKSKSDDRMDRNSDRADARFENTQKMEMERFRLSEHNSARADRNSANIASALSHLSPEALADAADKTRNGLPTGLPMRGGASANTAVAVANEAAKQSRGEYGTATTAAQDVRQGKAETTGEIAGVKAFNTGKQGDTVRSINVSMSHLETLREASKALNNGDVQLFNKISQTIAQQTGHAAPTTFDGMKQIVGDELVKGVVGSGGGQGDREEMAKTISRINSPEQFEGVFDSYQSLLGGQLDGLGRQYKNSTKRDDFESRLSPQARNLMTKDKPASGKLNAPKIGFVSGGHKFLGGDPSDKSNWEVQ